MNKLYRNKYIYVADSPLHGRGVFTSEDILPEEIIEQAPVIQPFEKSRNILLDPAYKNQYFFAWPGLCTDWKKSVDETGYLSVEQITYPVCVLGYGMLYNHSTNPNVVYEVFCDANIIEFRAKIKIKAGQELTICYGEGIKI